MNIDHIHFYVKDAKSWQNWLVKHLGFTALDINLDSTAADTCTAIVTNGIVDFLISSALSPTSPVAEFLRKHPPGVADVAFGVANVEAAMARAKAYGAEVLQPIQERLIGNVFRKCGQIRAWGGLSHTLMEQVKAAKPEISCNDHHIFTGIDHIVLNVPVGELDAAVSWYDKVLNFQPQQTFKIQTHRSGLYSQVMISREGGVQLPINEPASHNSQIQEFLEVNRGAGIQHIALKTRNLITTIADLRSRGLSLLSVPKTYYSQLQQRPGFPLSALELQTIAAQEILVDWQEDYQDALLLQIFTQPIFGEPTFFFEFIERRYQAQGFGEGNFRALFEAIEAEQVKRGSLDA